MFNKLLPFYIEFIGWKGISFMLEIVIILCHKFNFTSQIDSLVQNYKLVLLSFFGIYEVIVIWELHECLIVTT